LGDEQNDDIAFFMLCGAHEESLTNQLTWACRPGKKTRMISRRAWRCACVSTAVACIILVDTGRAHHSISGEFDNARQVTVEGTVKDYKLINPHTYIVVSVDSGRGSEDWTLTFGPATKLIRGSGWNEATLRPGDRVTATGRPAREGLGLYLAELIKADGTVLIDELEE
jgi:hypothetical protein